MNTVLTASLCLLLAGADEPTQPLQKYVYFEKENAIDMVSMKWGPKTRITKDDMEKIANLNPKKLSFVYVVIDRDAKTFFSKMTALESLVMEKTNFEDEDLKSLSKCKNLKFMNLVDSDITDGSVETLAEFKQLKMVYVVDTAISFQGVRKLEESRPDMKVYFLLPETPMFREKKVVE
jgi:hypothetical protein